MNSLDGRIENIFNGQLKDDKFRTIEQEQTVLDKLRYNNQYLRNWFINI